MPMDCQKRKKQQENTKKQNLVNGSVPDRTFTPSAMAGFFVARAEV